MARLLALFLLSFQAALGEDGEASCILQSHFPFQNMMLAQHNRSHHFDQGVEHLDDDALLEEDQGEYLGSQTNRVVECTSDEEEYDLVPDSPGRLLSHNEELASGSGVRFDQFDELSTGTTCHYGAAIWTKATNRAPDSDEDLQKCGDACRLLIVADQRSDFSSDPPKIDDCRTGPTRIDLRFDKATKVLGYNFWDNDESTSQNTKLFWRLEHTPSGWDGQATVPRTADGEGTGFQSIAAVSTPPQSVVKLRIQYAGSGGLKSLRLCRPKATAPPDVTCPNNDYFDLYFSGPGRFFDGNSDNELAPGTGIYFDSFNPRGTENADSDGISCIDAAMWTGDTNRGGTGSGNGVDRDLRKCPNGVDDEPPFCNLLIVAESQSRRGPSVELDDCKRGPTDIYLRLDPPRKVLGFEYWDNDHVPSHFFSRSFFTWRNVGTTSWDYWGVDQTAGWVQIPETNDGEGTGFVNIADHFIKPDTVDKIQIVFSGPGDHSNGDGGALRSLRVCNSDTTSSTTAATTSTTQVSTTTSRPGDAGTTTTQGPVQCPFDPSSFQDFNFYPGVGRKLSIGEEIVMGKGIYLDSFTPGDASCEGAGIWTRQTNRDDDDLLGCTDNTIPGGGCNLLVVVEDQSLLTDPDNIKIDDCGAGGSTITLRLDPPQPVLQFTFFDNEDGENSKFKWEDADGTSEEVNIPVSGDNKSITVDISGNTNLPPNNVKFITITYGGSGGLKDFRLCPPASTTSTTTTTTAGPTTTTTTAEPTTTTTTAGPTTTTTTTITTTTTTTTAPPPPPPAAPPVECPSGSLPYNFSFRPGMGRQLSFNEEIVTDSGVFFAGVSLPPSPTPCIGAGIWTPITNLNDGDLLGCPDNGNNAINGVNGDGCNLLVVLEDESQLNDTSNIKIDDCRQGGSIISLQLVPPQPVLSYSFWDNENGEGSLFTWQNENGASNTVNIPVSGNNNGVTEDISTNQQLPPNDVQFVNVTYGGSGGLQTLRLCSTTTTTPMVNEPPPTTTGAVVEGDPHIHTFEGEHYLLLNQGTFDLWHLSGLQTSFVSNVSLGLTKKVDVNWQVYTHYSGSKSFTKAILVVDKSGGHLRQMAELTSKDCQWRIRMPGKEWEVVKESKLFFVPDGLPDGKKDYVTGFKVGLENQHLKMSMNTEQGKTNIAGIYTTCRPAHFLNLKLHMMRTNSGDEKFVKGEMRGFQRVKPISGKRPVGLTPATASALQLDTEMQSTDEEFSVKRRWQELGGSELTAEYLEAVDEKGPISHFLGTCDEEAKREAHAICAKHLGAAMAKGPEAAFFNDCVTDVCNGAGEVAAELAAELRVSSRRKDKD